MSKAFGWPSLPANAWLALFAVGLFVAMFLAFHDVRASKEAALRTIAAALGNSQRLDDLRRRQDREDREQERLKDRMEEQKRGEVQRRTNVLRAIRQKYVLSHDGLSAGMLAGIDPLPKDWVDAELAKLGETWRQDVYR